MSDEGPRQGSTTDVLDVKPHPRLLTVLGDIQFAGWQCLAELVDNALDDFLARDARGQSPTVDGEPPTISITLPGRGSSPKDGQVWVRDTGQGMSIDRLNLAIRAGWTGNERHGQLGLFGMGFNIATARLGHTTKVRTTRSGDPEWLSVTIDLRKLQTQSEFLVPVLREPKTNPKEHGTEIVVGDLRPELHEVLSRGGVKIREQLGDVYSYLLRERGYKLLVDGKPVRPRMPCIWSPERFVMRSGEKIHAVTEINSLLPAQAVCQICGMWQDPVNTACEDCQSRRLEVRERRIRGWLGIQRYVDKADYGIDFLRNGRKILIRDLTVFEWTNPEEPGARSEREYPIDDLRHPEGRIVGEIHCDHVRVNYQKSAFEYDTPEWRQVVRSIRGSAPIRPEIAKRLGYTPNVSPLARLFHGYRRNEPAGSKYLIPGNGTKPIHERTREWATLFRKGNPEFQTDEQWHNAVIQHEEAKKRPVPPEATDPLPGGPDVLGRLGLNKPANPTENNPEPQPSPKPETEDDRNTRWRESALAVTDLKGRYRIHDAGAAIDVTVWAVQDLELKEGPEAPRVPAIVSKGRGSTVEVFVEATHPLFVDYATDPRDVALTELANWLKIRADIARPISSVLYDVRHECLKDTKVTATSLAEQANMLLAQVREAMLPVVAGASDGFWQSATSDERIEAERRYAAEGGGADWSEAKATGEWIRHVPPSALARLLQQRPSDFLDGKVFRAPYSSFEDPRARDLALSPVLSYLTDVGLLAEQRRRRTAEELSRGRLSCVLLEQELALEDSPTNEHEDE